MTQTEAWQARVSQLSPGHPSIRPWCGAESERESGYWPYPWVNMPPGGQPFDQVDYIATPAANSVETTVVQIQVPYNWDGVITGLANAFTGPGFQEGSGQLIWRLRVGLPNLQGAPVRNYANILNSLGSPGFPRDVPGGIVVGSNQYIQFTVTHPIGSPLIPAGTRIMCNVAGYFWPRGSSSY